MVKKFDFIRNDLQATNMSINYNENDTKDLSPGLGP